MEASIARALSLWRDLSDFATTRLGISTSAFQIAVSLFAVLVAAVAVGAVGTSLPSRPIRYTVPPPKIPSPETTVEHTTVKLPGSSAVQCYAPATGQFLGLVNASSAGAIDRC
ncbi:Putative aldehyde dehydrogenase-like protein, partial [Tolypocladium paradoxum]